jgi:adenosylmethionine-8-amino-7-oxononanoate aminotransferase
MAQATRLDAEALRQVARERLWMGSVRYDQVVDHGPLVFERGDGIHVWDVDGRRFIDAMAGAWVVGAGHGRAEIAGAMVEQAERLAFVLNEGYTNPTTIRLAERLAAYAPDGLNRVFFTCGGSEAIETALKVVRQHAVSRGQVRYKVIARQHSYHGATWGAMSVTGFEEWRWPFAPQVPGASYLPHPSCYRCPLQLTYPSCGVACAESLVEAIEKAGPRDVGAVIAEPVSAASAAHVPPDEYWPRIREICDQYGILLIADEIVTGFGRTGRLFGLDHWGVEPDILVVGKGVTSGYAPLAAAIVRDDLARSLDPAGFVHGFTFSGHPVSCAAAMANLDILEREGLVANAAEQGRRLKDALVDRLAGCPIVGDVRGLGLLQAVELVADRGSKERFDAAIRVGDRVKRRLIANGVVCRTGNQIRLGPPLVIDAAGVADLAERVARSVWELHRELDGAAA